MIKVTQVNLTVGTALQSAEIVDYTLPAGLKKIIGYSINSTNPYPFFYRGLVELRFGDEYFIPSETSADLYLNPSYKYAGYTLFPLDLNEEGKMKKYEPSSKLMTFRVKDREVATQAFQSYEVSITVYYEE